MGRRKRASRFYEEIVEGVYLVGSDALSGNGDCMVYAIGLDEDHICLIDAGAGNAFRILENINHTPLAYGTISHLILTHCHFDHIGAAYQFKDEFPELKIIAHDLDADAIEGKPGTSKFTAASWYGRKLHPVKVDARISGEKQILDLFGKKLEIIHTPGHTPGSISVLYKYSKLDNSENSDCGSGQDAEEIKILFAQDVHGPFMEEFGSDINLWAKSMHKLLDLNADILCEGHFGIFRGKEAVNDYITSYLERYGFSV